MLMHFVNFAILEILHRVRRIDFISFACDSLGNKYNFPSYSRAYKSIAGEEHIPVTLPENYEIEQAVREAFHKAMTRALKLKILKAPLKDIPTPELSHGQSERF